MSSLPWIKLYTDFLDDPILGRLTDATTLCFVHLLLVAGECDAEGYLIDGGYPLTLDDLSWRLRRPPYELEEELDMLTEAGLIEKQGDLWLIGSFSKRQGRSQSAQREAWRQQKRRQRARKALEKFNARQESDLQGLTDNPFNPSDISQVFADLEHNDDISGLQYDQEASNQNLSTRTSGNHVRPVEEEIEIEEEKKKKKKEEIRKEEQEKRIEAQTDLAAPNFTTSGFKPDVALSYSSLTQNEAITVYTLTTGYPPGKSYEQQIVEQVTDIELWIETLAHWMMHGWNPRNVTGQLELYRRGGSNSCRYCPDSDFYVGVRWDAPDS